jgi:uncharacterized protein YcbK (DUF882 family)
MDSQQATGISRRNLIVGAGAMAASLILPGEVFAKSLKKYKRRKLALLNVHTREDVEVTYFKNGRYQESALMKINELLRDHRRDEVTNIDVKVIDQIFATQKKLRNDDQIHVLSGYRSKATNEELRQRSRGVARKSYHTLGQATDIYIPGIKLRKQRTAAISLLAGGVGYYPRSSFIHLDSGPVRKW